MSKKLFFLTSFVLVLSFVVTNAANADPGLVGWWKFDEGSGTTASDSSGNGNHGTLIDNVQWAAGQIGGALKFDGSPGYLLIPHSDSLKLINQGDFTIAMWFRQDVVTGIANLLQQTDANGTGRTLLLADSADGIRSYLGGTSTLSGVIEEAGTWYHVAMVVTEGGATDTIEFYIDGEPSGTPAQVGSEDTEGDYLISTNKGLDGRWLNGLVDDVRFYNHALSEVEILGAMQGSGEVWPYAFTPDPADGAVLEATWVNLSWKPGGLAVSNDVYIGENFDDVNDGAEGTFVGNQPATTLIVGFPGFACPGGLVPGTIYYWRIDEVNDTEPNSPWKGDVWSFWIPPKTAYNPNPADGVKFMDTDVELSWTAGFGAKLHHVYFGDNFDDVNSAVVGLPQSATTYTPGTLELDKVYYWRIDEFDGVVTHKGNVLSFRVKPFVPITDPNLVGWWKFDEGSGTNALDWSGHNHDGKLQGDPQWVDGYDGDALEFDGSDIVEAMDYKGVTGTHSRTISAWFKTTTTGEIISWGADSAGQKWIFRVQTSNGTDGAIRVEVNGGYIVGVTDVRDGQWHHGAVVLVDDGSPDVIEIKLYLDGALQGVSAQLDEPIDTASGSNVRIGQAPWGSRPFIGQIDNVRIYDKALTQEEISLAMRGDLLLAWGSKPSQGSILYIRDVMPLSWSPGDNASQHDVYFGTDRDAVANADETDTTGIYRGRQGATSYNPAEGVEWGGGPYYWRIDEYNTDATISKGSVWSFTVADFIVIDDFEDYDVGNNEIWWVWLDGFGYASHPTKPPYPGNGTGSMVGDETTGSYMEETIVHGGGKSMPVLYDNNQQAKLRYSEVEKTLSSQRDWTEEGVGVLSLWFYGVASNAAEPMYVALNGNAVVTHDNPNAAQVEEWTEWNIDLQAFADQGVNLANVNTIAIGLGNKKNPVAGGSGTMYFDDIRLYRPAP